MPCATIDRSVDAFKYVGLVGLRCEMFHKARMYVTVLCTMESVATISMQEMQVLPLLS